MDARERDVRFVDAQLCGVPDIGRWLWMVQETRDRTKQELAQLTPELIDWLPPGNASSIGTVLYHIADIEADWLYVEVLEQSIPADVMALFPYPTRDAAGRLTQVTGLTLEEHIERLDTVRAKLIEAVQQLDLDDFRRTRSFPHYEVTPEWVLHHLAQHEAEHRGQIGALRAAAVHALNLV